MSARNITKLSHQVQISDFYPCFRSVLGKITQISSKTRKQSIAASCGGLKKLLSLMSGARFSVVCGKMAVSPGLDNKIRVPP